MAKRRLPVDFSAAADRDLHAIHDYISLDRPSAARRWLRGIKRQIELLRILPLSFEMIPEAEDLELNCRHVIYGNYRVIYQVGESRIYIIRIVHAARMLTRAMLGLDPNGETEA